MDIYAPRKNGIYESIFYGEKYSNLESLNDEGWLSAKFERN